MKTLVIGSGGREHALVRACLQSRQVSEVIAAPGNGGIEQDVVCFPVSAADNEGLLKLVHDEQVEFVIVGPEIPLSMGLADALESRGVVVYGPRQKGAQLEASKVFSKEFLVRHSIPTAKAVVFTDFDAAVSWVSSQPFPTVIKAEGLAAGKGVVVAKTFEEAESALRDMLVKGVFGSSGKRVLVEEFMPGEEASIMLMVSGSRYVMLPASQDHKRVGEGDTGPNTGGMGAFAPAAVVTEAVRLKLIHEIIEPTLRGLEAEGFDYRGTLYIGIMISEGQPRVVEFNVRFGDPECQILLPLLAEDPVKLMLDCARGSLEPRDVKVRAESAMIVVQATEGYPGSYRKGDVIHIPDALPENAWILHAGTRKTPDGQLVTDGGRVTGIVGIGKTLQEAADAAYGLCGKVHWKGIHFRRDIGWRQLS